jgi:hypothetical protein
MCSRPSTPRGSAPRGALARSGLRPERHDVGLMRHSGRMRPVCVFAAVGEAWIERRGQLTFMIGGVQLKECSAAPHLSHRCEMRDHLAAGTVRDAHDFPEP